MRVNSDRSHASATLPENRAPDSMSLDGQTEFHFPPNPPPRVRAFQPSGLSSPLIPQSSPRRTSARRNSHRRGRLKICPEAFARPAEGDRPPESFSAASRRAAPQAAQAEPVADGSVRARKPRALTRAFTHASTRSFTHAFAHALTRPLTRPASFSGALEAVVVVLATLAFGLAWAALELESLGGSDAHMHGIEGFATHTTEGPPTAIADSARSRPSLYSADPWAAAGLGMELEGSWQGPDRWESEWQETRRGEQPRPTSADRRRTRSTSPPPPETAFAPVAGKSKP